MRELHWTVAQVGQLTLYQLACICREPKDLDEALRYSKMSPRVKQVADEVKKVYKQC